MTPVPRHTWSVSACALAWALSAGPVAAQTPAAPPASSYTLADETALGREAATILQQRLDRLVDRHVDAYVHALGRRLVDALPARVRHAGFDDTIIVLDESEVVSAAVPGGPLFISRAMIELAPSDAALAGLLAHELSHVALRHATAQATAGERYQLGAITGRAIGAAVGEQAVGIMDRAAQFAVTSYFLTYDPKHEQQADRLAAEIMERGGYDPGAGGTMFHVAKTKGGARGGGWWAMRHPSKDRDEAIDAAGPGPAASMSHALTSIQARLQALPAKPPAGFPTHPRPVPLGSVGYNVVGPAGESRSVTAGDALQLIVPANWDRMPTGNTVIFAPAGAYIPSEDGATAVTHGLQVGIARSLTGTLHGDVHMLLASFGRNNPSITWTPAFRQVTIGGRRGVTTTVSHVSPVTGEFETISVSAAHVPDGSLLYVVGVAPQYEAGVYTNAFTRVLESIQILD